MQKPYDIVASASHRGLAAPKFPFPPVICVHRGRQPLQEGLANLSAVVSVTTTLLNSHIVYLCTASTNIRRTTCESYSHRQLLPFTIPGIPSRLKLAE